MREMDYRRAKEVLRDRRVELRMGVIELAQEAGLHKTTVYRLEEAIKEDPNKPIEFETMEKLATALDLTLSDFFARIEGLRPTGQPDQESRTPDPEASHGPSVQKELSDVDRTFFVAIGETLAESFAQSMERFIAARAHAGAPQKQAAVRGGRRRKVD